MEQWASNVMQGLSVDFSGIAQLNDSSVNLVSTTDVTGEIGQWAGSLKGISNNLTTVLSDENAILTEQDITTGILNREFVRLKEKKQSTDSIIAGQLRMQQLNTSYTHQYSAYLQIIYFCAVVVILLMVLAALGHLVPGIPPSFVTVLAILLLGPAVIYGGILISRVNNRDKMDFDRISQINMPIPSKDASGSAIGTATTSLGPMWSPPCQGSVCCQDTSWNESKGSCDAFTGFSGISGISGTTASNGLVKPYSASSSSSSSQVWYSGLLDKWISPYP